MSKIVDNSFNENENQKLVGRYEAMRKENKIGYLDVFEIERIINHYIKQDNVKKALELCNVGVEIHPSSFRLKQKKAQLFIELDLSTQALKILNMIAKVEPNNVEVLILKGIALSQLGDVKKSLANFENVMSLVENDSDRVVLLSDISLTFIKIGRYDIAAKFLSEAYEIDNSDYEIILDLAFCLDRTNDAKRSIGLYKKYLEKNPFSDIAWYNIGICYDKQENTSLAMEAYEFALALNDEFASALINKASLLQSEQMYSEAIESYKTFLLLEPENEDVYFSIGKCYYELGDYLMSIQSFKKATQLNNEHSDSWYFIGLISLEIGKYKKSKNFIKKAIKINDENPSYWFVLAKIYINLNELKKSEKAYLKTINIEPFIEEVWLDYFDFKFSQNEYSNALAILNNATEYIEENASINTRFAAIYFLLGKETEAFGHLQKALFENINSKNEFLLYYPQAESNKKIRKFIVNSLKFLPS